MSPHDFPAAGLVTSRLRLRKLEAADAAEVLRYQVENRRHLQPWEPARTDAFYSLEASERRVEDMFQQMNQAGALHLLIRSAENDLPIGECHFTNVVRGPFQACHLGFSIDANA